MRLFIADADSAVRLALQMYLQQEPGIYVTGIASESQGLPAQLEASRPDMLLLDAHLPGASIEDLLSDIRGLTSPPKIVVLSIRPEEKGAALSAGADAFIGKSAPPDELVEVVRSLGGRRTNDHFGRDPPGRASTID